MSDHAGADPVGTLGEEATKLFHALRAWAEDNGGERASTTRAPGAAAGGAAARHIDEHLGIGDADCRYCPLCRVISMARSTSPEVRQHLFSAATSLVQAAAAVFATQVPDDREDPTAGRVADQEEDH